MNSEQPAPPTSAAASRRRLSLVAGWRLAVLAGLVLLSLFAFRSGLAFRRWMWDYTRWIHFYPDVNNGYHWGSEGNLPAEHPRGYLNVYDLVAARAAQQNDEEMNYGLDYAPLRLLLMTRWVRWTRAHFPDLAEHARRATQNGFASTWDTQAAFFAPTLGFNTAMEVLATVGIFLLTRHWAVRRFRLARIASTDEEAVTWRGRARTWLETPNVYRGWVPAYLAAMLFWFNPAIVISAHAWPTWDMWIIPFFIWAVYLASLDLWFCAGLVIAVGAMFKGQQLFVAPMFILWPIFAGRPWKALRWSIGLVLGVAVIALPWLVTFVPGGVNVSTTGADRLFDRQAIAWLACVAIAATALPIAIRRFRPWVVTGRSPRAAWAIWTALLLVAIALSIWPFFQTQNRPYFWIGILLAITTAGAGWMLAFRQQLLMAAGAVGVCMLLCAVLFQGNFNWLYIGWGYGTRHYYHMTQGVSDNLAGILHVRYGWDNIDEPVYTFDAHTGRLWPTQAELFSKRTVLTIRQLLCMIYVVTFLISVVGIAIQYRRNDPKFLIAIVAPWLMFFAFLPQIHERYLLYAAGVGCCLTAVSLGMTLINLFFTALTAIMTLQVMLGTAASHRYMHDFGNNVSTTFKWTLLETIKGTYPDAGWAVILCAGIFLYLSLTPSSRLKSADTAERAKRAAAPPDDAPPQRPQGVEPSPDAQSLPPDAEPSPLVLPAPSMEFFAPPTVE